MRAHIVLAHPEAQSFNAYLGRVAAEALESQGWTVTSSDLYAMQFDPCERAEHYRSRRDGGRFDVQAEQHHASAIARFRTWWRAKSKGWTARTC